jgi:hypothetical protein
LAALTSQSVIRRHPASFHSPVHHELIVTQGERDTYFRLDATGKRIWELLSTPKTVEDLCTELLSEYHAERGAIEIEVLTFLADMERQDLIEIT